MRLLQKSKAFELFEASYITVESYYFIWGIRNPKVVSLTSKQHAETSRFSKFTPGFLNPEQFSSWKTAQKKILLLNITGNKFRWWQTSNSIYFTILCWICLTGINNVHGNLFSELNNSKQTWKFWNKTLGYFFLSLKCSVI